jgi:hypothetical protein
MAPDGKNESEANLLMQLVPKPSLPVDFTEFIDFTVRRVVITIQDIE